MHASFGFPSRTHVLFNVRLLRRKYHRLPRPPRPNPAARLSVGPSGAPSSICSISYGKVYVFFIYTRVRALACAHRHKGPCTHDRAAHYTRKRFHASAHNVSGPRGSGIFRINGRLSMGERSRKRDSCFQALTTCQCEICTHKRITDFFRRVFEEADVGA